MSEDSPEDFLASLSPEEEDEDPKLLTPKPFLKWAGGKAKLVPYLLDLFPKHVDTYYEPFLGGGAVFWAMAHEGRFEQAVLNDWNEELVGAYKAIQSDRHRLIRFLRVLDAEYRKDPAGTFERWRRPPADVMAALGGVERAARFIFLNRTAFNGLHRLNKKGEFNTPWGKYANPTICNEPLIESCSAYLDGGARDFTATSGTVDIIQGDFAVGALGAEEGDLVYLDPPYVPMSGTSDFTSYTERGFSLDDQYRVVALFKELAHKGVMVVVSNSDTPEVRAMFAGWEMHSVPMRRNINVKGDKRGEVSELVVVSRPGLATDLPVEGRLPVIGLALVPPLMPCYERAKLVVVNRHAAGVVLRTLGAVEGEPTLSPLGAKLDGLDMLLGAEGHAPPYPRRKSMAWDFRSPRSRRPRGSRPWPVSGIHRAGRASGLLREP